MTADEGDLAEPRGLENFIQIQKKRGQMELTRKLSPREEEALELMSDGEAELAQLEDSEDGADELDWDPHRAAEVTKAGIFKEDSEGALGPAERSLVEAFRISRNLGLEFEAARQMIREFVFSVKKVEEENLQRENINLRRERKKKFKRLARQMSEDPFDPDTRWEDGPRTPEEARLDLLAQAQRPVQDLEEAAEEMTERFLEMKARGRRGELDGEDLLDLQRDTNARKFLEEFFLTRQDKLAPCTRGFPIEVDEILSHRSSKTLFIFWAFLDKSLERAARESEERGEEHGALVSDVSVRLNRFAGYLGNLMLRATGGRKPPRVIFLQSRKQAFVDQAEAEFRRVFPDLVREQMRESRRGFVGEVRSEAELEQFIARNEGFFVRKCLLRHEELFSNEAVLSEVKKNFGSIDGYIQRIQEAGRFLGPHEKLKRSRRGSRGKSRADKLAAKEKLRQGFD